jgi:hypothetical protein
MSYRKGWEGRVHHDAAQDLAGQGGGDDREEQPGVAVGDQHHALALLGPVQAGADRLDHPGPIRRPVVGDVQ